MSAAAYKRGERYTVRIPRRDKPAVPVATGTRDRATALAMQRMAKALADRHEWILLEAITGERSRRRRRERLAALLEAYRANRLDELRAAASEPDLRDYVSG